jgi:hypothetical protein
MKVKSFLVLTTILTIGCLKTEKGDRYNNSILRWDHCFDSTFNSCCSNESHKVSLMKIVKGHHYSRKKLKALQHIGMDTIKSGDVVIFWESFSKYTEVDYSGVMLLNGQMLRYRFKNSDEDITVENLNISKEEYYHYTGFFKEEPVQVPCCFNPGLFTKFDIESKFTFLESDVKIKITNIEYSDAIVE